MKRKNKQSFDFPAFKDQITSQFTSLDRSNPSSWPSLPRNLLHTGVVVAVVASLWFAWLSSVDDEFTAEKSKEIKLRASYSEKLMQSSNLEVLKKQRERVQQHVLKIEKQLPSKSEMDALLSDINHAGLSHRLQFELFRPGQVFVSSYYAELPIAVKVTGTYHDMGDFVSDIANLSRIVTLNNISITPAKDGLLAMEATAKTFRYLDEDEITLQRKKAAAAAKGAKK